MYLSGFVDNRFMVWRLDDSTTILGRSSQSTIRVPHQTVSKSHAEISLHGGSCTVRDLGSRNGTTVNGVRIRDVVGIKPGDEVAFGDIILTVAADEPHQATVYNDSASLLSSVRFSVDDLLRKRSEPATGQLLHVLAEAGRLLVLFRPLTETCEDILGIAEKAVPASRLSLLLKREGTSDPVQVAARHRGGRAEDPLVLSRTMVGKVLSERSSVLTSDATVDPRFRGQESIMIHGIRSAMAVPLFDNENVLGILYADTDDPATHYSREHLEVFTLLANMAAVKITNARLLEAQRERDRLEQELATAARIQRALLPATCPQIVGYEIHAFQEPCFEVGGDLYDFYPRSSDGQLYLLLGDVSGKGMGAALLMSSFLSYARVIFETGAGPAEIVTRLNTIICRNTEPEHYITLFLGRLDLSTGSLRYVNAGHPSPFLVAGAGLRELTSTSPPVGLLPHLTYEEAEVELPCGTLLAIFSDGIAEARWGEEFYKVEQLQRSFLSLSADAALVDIAQTVVRSVDDFLAGHPRNDDVTLVLLRRSPTGGPSVRSECPEDTASASKDELAIKS